MRTLIVKVGGGALDLDAVARDIASLSALEIEVVILHGANALRDRMAEQLGRPPRVLTSLSGISSVHSDDDALDLLMAAYAGTRNKRLVEALRMAGVDAVGLSGLDGGLVQGRQNQGIRIRDGRKKLLVRDWSGAPVRIRGRLLRLLMAEGCVPVLTVPMAGEDGRALNTENDEVLALLAAELCATDVVSLMEAPGLLADPEDPSSRIPALVPGDLPDWEGRVQGRMRRKIRALRSLFERCPAPGPRVVLADGRVDRPVLRALEGHGTVLAHAIAGEADGLEALGTAATTAPTSVDWLERQARHELDVYGKRGLTLVRAEGCEVWDAEGRRYLDGMGGMGALALGHRHPAQVAALRQAMDGPWFISGAFGAPPRVEFLERLHRALPPELSRTFLSNSGTEAVEAALKVARAHTGRTPFVAAVRGFHGRTMGALSVTHDAHYRDPFGPLGGEVRRVALVGPEPLREAMTQGAPPAALILEPVQGEGGVHPLDPALLREARDLCDRSGALLILDEVQTGFGRTGHLFAFEASGIVPDVLCLAKSIAGGLPLGATVVREGITLAPGTHGSTFGGNPLAVAVASATLEVLTGPDGDALLRGAVRKGRRLAERLRDADLAAVREVRQVGLMIGIQLRCRVRPVLAALQDDGVLALAAGATTLRLLPPLVMSDAQIEEVGDALVRALSEALLKAPSPRAKSPKAKPKRTPAEPARPARPARP